ncbi:sigma-70 family RNA polymerase sigma factor [Nocardioides panaciterrulae]|uniref:RNA polymerase sigma-B factor n=1 Tax=Nocardioides panaciterrulae TaxID=661492 RepID=A0A7Y9E4B1_9ACTN|nr:sigma-70 family RNA polymerase sigma factor [Nocardioides panaciterrulae]NYD40924.1 RNA polymerase sigma-B factor [Nocardioides panaciterrulae]
MGHVATSRSRTAVTDRRADARATRRAETARLLEDAALAASEQERASLLEDVIRLNMQVAGEIARRYHNRGVPSDDIDQVANLGLVKAAQGFDPAQGSDFLSFAVPTIRGEIRRYFRDFGWTIRPPRSIQELQSKITAAEGELFQSLGRSPRPTEIAEHLGVDLEQVLDSLGASGCFSPVSLDTPVAEGERGPVDRLGGLDPAFASAEARVALRSAMRGLTQRERRILEMRFFGGCTQAEIGAEVGVTQMQVSRLLSRLLTRMRRRLEDQVPAA